jgi:sec-independent protein translocase protein TatC
MNKEEPSFWDHLEELRGALLGSTLVILTGTIICFLFHEPLITMLTRPYERMDGLAVDRVEQYVIRNTSTTTKTYRASAAGELVTVEPGDVVELEARVGARRLILLGPAEGMILSLKVSVWAGVILTAPLWGGLLFRFVLPALRQRERSVAWGLYFGSIGCFFAGVALAYCATIPIANTFLYGFNQGIGENFWSLSQYVDFTLGLSLANGAAFELFVILMGLVHLGVVSPEALTAKRRHVIVGMFIVGAVLTPPDVITQCLVACPLVLLYEIAILYAKGRAAVRHTNKPVAAAHEGVEV